ncbi:MAG: methylmalonyl-CoA epimerase [Planctomycetota bacterium]|nr:methylmalonyl-CoA epimerase [Planctomycetota bacterium]
MAVLNLDHIGIGVLDLDRALKVYATDLGLHLEETETLESMKLKVAKLSTGNTLIELIQPLPGEETMSKAIERRGEGIHHVCLTVDNVEAATKLLFDRGYKPVWDKPRTGASGRLVNFLSPKDTFGVLIELSQKP